MDKLLEAYIAVALCDIDPENTNEQEVSRDKLSPGTLAAMTEDCKVFYEQNKAIIDNTDNILRYGPDCDSPYARAGHDFYLTRCGHGAGFWDGDWEEEAGKVLTAYAHKVGEFYLYFGDDGLIYH